MPKTMLIDNRHSNGRAFFVLLSPYIHTDYLELSLLLALTFPRPCLFLLTPCAHPLISTKSNTPTFVLPSTVILDDARCTTHIA